MFPISIGIMAHNEEKNIASLLKILQLQQLKHFKISEIFVISSGSTDKTNEIVQEFSRKNNKIKLVIEKERNGKFSSINIFLKIAKENFLVLSSADIMPNKNTIENLCFPLLNKRVGIVGSHPIPKNNKHSFATKIANIEWKLHHKLASNDVKFGEMIAFKKMFLEIHSTAVDEEEIAYLIKKKGLKGVYAKNAIIKNKSPETIADLIKQRRRIYSGHLQLENRTNIKIPTTQNLKLAKLLFSSSEFSLFEKIFTSIIEAYARLLGFIDTYLFKKNHDIWEIAKTTKTKLAKETYNNFTIIIPTLNEESNIGDLIKDITEKYSNINIIISDDASTDNTKDVVKRLAIKNNRIFFLDRTNSKIKGLTASVVDAVNIVKTKYLIVMDGDYQHPPETIKEITDNLENYDLVIGIRRSVKDWKISRQLMSIVANLLAKIKLISNKNKSSDLMSGFFGVKTSIFKESILSKNNFELEGYKVLFDFLKQQKQKLDIKEVEYDFGLRRNGTSKIGPKQIKAFIKSIFS